MKRVVWLMAFLAMVIFSVPSLKAQSETGNPQSTPTDSTNQQGNTETNKTGNTGTTSGTQETQSTGTENTTGSTSGTQPTGTDNTGMGTQSANNSMGTTNSEMKPYSMNSSGGGVKSLSGLDEKPDPEVVSQFKPIAEERANELVSKLGLESDKADKISKSIMNYFDNYWESRVALDKENDAEDIKDHNMDLADQRVDLIDDIEGELTDDQINQFKSFKVDWWKSLDLALFDVQQNAATSSLARDKSDTDEQQ
jgi:hypothetical protein